MSNEKEKEKPKKKNFMKDKQMTISEFVDLRGGIHKLNRRTLEKLYAKEKRKAEDWMELLVSNTMLKAIDKEFLEREVA